jgi:hypothetical protein
MHLFRCVKFLLIVDDHSRLQSGLQFRHRNVTCVNLISAPHHSMRKTFTFLPFKEARKKLDFVLPVDGQGRNNFRGANVLLRSRRGYSRKLGSVIRPAT